MENSYFKNTNFPLPFGELQARFGRSAFASRSSAATHSAAFPVPPPQGGQRAEPSPHVNLNGPPPPFEPPGLNYGPVYSSDRTSSVTFPRAPLESERFGSLPPTRMFASCAQFQPPPRSNGGGEFYPASWSVPAPPMNVNIPPPPSVNVPPPPINRNIPPPGFNPRVPPPTVFSARCPPTVVPSSASTNALVCSRLVLTTVSQASSFNSTTHIAGAGDRRFGLPPQPVPSFINCQRIPSDMNDCSVGGSVVQHTSLRQSFDGAFSNVGRSSNYPSVPSDITTVSKSSTAPADKCTHTDDQPMSLSVAGDTTHSSITGVDDVARTCENIVPSSRTRRRASTESNVTFAKFRKLLKEAILLNDRLRKYTENCLSLYAEGSTDDSENLTLLDSAESHGSHSDDTNNECVTSELNGPSQNCANEPSEKRTVRIVAAGQNHQRASSTSPKAAQSGDTSSVIDKQEAVKIWERLKELRIQITSFAAAVASRQKRTVSKRRRLKRRRRSLYEVKCELSMKRQRRHDEIDKHMNEVRQKQLAVKMELEMKAAADSTLAEVRRKISETNSCMKLIGQLRKLRQLRKDQAERKGIVVRRSADEMFEQRAQSLTAALTEQMDLYEAEQRTLQVMLETEQEQTKEKEREQQQVRMKERLASYEDRLHTWLFGEQPAVDPLDPMLPYTQYYDLASYSIDTFVKIRQEWDVYAVPASSESGSRIPLGWVIPAEPTDEVWASALKH